MPFNFQVLRRLITPASDGRGTEAPTDQGCVLHVLWQFRFSTHPNISWNQFRLSWFGPRTGIQRHVSFSDTFETAAVTHGDLGAEICQETLTNLDCSVSQLGKLLLDSVYLKWLSARTTPLQSWSHHYPHHSKHTSLNSTRNRRRCSLSLAVSQDLRLREAGNRRSESERIRTADEESSRALGSSERQSRDPWTKGGGGRGGDQVD